MPENGRDPWKRGQTAPHTSTTAQAQSDERQALDGAREALRATLTEREHGLVEREAALQSAAHELAERDRTAAVRTATLDEALALAREQLLAANQRAQALEATAQEREAECARLRKRILAVETAGAKMHDKLEAVTAAHRAERSQLQARHDAAEGHWMLELDRTRHEAKEAARDHERQLQELRTQIGSLHDKRDELRQQLADARAELKAAGELRTQLDRHFQQSQPKTLPRTKEAKSKRLVKRKRPT